MIPALLLSRLSVRRSSRAVVAELSATVAQASWFGIIGANGSGKTSLLRAVAGRLPIAGGRCEVLGRECAGDRRARAKAIGFAPPIDALSSTLQIGQLLELAGDPIAVQRQRSGALWQALQIDRLLGVSAGECSSGMRQRASIALAFATPAPIVILDEPFNWLDPVAAFDTRAALAAMVQGGTTLVTALHDLTTLCGYCDSGLVMSKGRVNLDLATSALRTGRADAAEFEQALVAALR